MRNKTLFKLMGKAGAAFALMLIFGTVQGTAEAAPRSQQVLDALCDISCGHNGNKRLICHVPPGNPDNSHTLCVGANSLPAHLAPEIGHDTDFCGPCLAIELCDEQATPPDCSDLEDDDRDADGVCSEVDNCPEVCNPGQEDTDGDGIGDACDFCPEDEGNDMDGDGICSPLDNCPEDGNADQNDTDGDLIGDACDNCPEDSNGQQQDADMDGFGDVCDDDDDTPTEAAGESEPGVWTGDGNANVVGCAVNATTALHNNAWQLLGNGLAMIVPLFFLGMMRRRQKVAVKK